MTNKSSLDFNTIDETIFSHRRIAFVGVAKNSGKTTTMNFCLKRAFQTQRDVLAVSIGLDGEKLDAILGTPKPPVVVYEGQWVITTRKMIDIADAELEINTDLGIRTPLGDTVIAKVKKAGEIILTGLRHRQDLRKTIDALDIDHVFIDGAYGRIMAAHGLISDSIILSTGGVVGVSIEEVHARTKAMIENFEISKAKDWRLTLIEKAIEKEATLLGGPNLKDGIPLSNRSALLGLEDVQDIWSSDVKGIAIVGMLSDSVANTLLDRNMNEKGYIIVSDPTSIQLSAPMLRRLERQWNIETYYGNKVIAISVNPTSVQGHRFKVGELEKRLRKTWKDLPIFDPVAMTDLPMA